MRMKPKFIWLHILTDEETKRLVKVRAAEMGVTQQVLINLIVRSYFGLEEK